ncbi:MAG: hypothetical protein IKU34_03590 [Clostridia bacterium]|nr:hypothetical protein [Clostridia bacterium]
MINLPHQLHSDDFEQILYDRVEKVVSPLLVIGLGGAGADAVRTIKKTFSERFELHPTEDGKQLPYNTRYLVFDSDSTSANGFDADEFVDISQGVNVNRLLADPMHLHLSPCQKRWIHRDLRLTTPVYFGSGSYRAVARLMLDEHSNAVFSSLHQALRKLVSAELGAHPPVNAIHIIVVSGMGGGTGSGIFLDIAQIVQNIMGRFPGIAHTLCGYFIMPDITVAHAANTGNMARLDTIQRNGYAALKELDFWMNYAHHQTRYEMEYTNGIQVVWKKPFDHVTLICGTDVQGCAFNNPYRHAQQTIAKTLLHLMADKPDNNGFDSLRAYDSTLEAMAHAFPGPMFPTNTHGYRAIASCSLSYPIKELLNYECRLLFKDFMPARDENGKYILDDMFKASGFAVRCFQKIMAEDFPQLYQDFVRTVPFPHYCLDFDARNTSLVEALRLLRPIPHSACAAWQIQQVAPSAQAFVDRHFNTVWMNFIDLCRSFISSPGSSVFNLVQILRDNPENLLRVFRDHTDRAHTLCDMLYSQIHTAQRHCDETYQRFLNPPLLSRTRSIQTYLDALRNLLDTIRQFELAKQYALVMKQLFKRIATFVDSALVPLCELFESMEADLNHPQSLMNIPGSDLFDSSLLQQDIHNAFDAANINHAVSCRFLSKVCDCAFEFDPDHAASDGMIFPFMQNGSVKVLELIKQELSARFADINSMSADDIMRRQCCSHNPEVQHANQLMYLNTLCNTMAHRTHPLFSLNAHDYNIQYSTTKLLYISVPKDAPDTYHYFDSVRQLPGFAGIQTLTRSCALRDEIFCCITWDALPLSSYSWMEQMRQSYDMLFQRYPHSAEAAALHLVWSGNDDNNIRENWRLLPSPAITQG